MPFLGIRRWWLNYNKKLKWMWYDKYIVPIVSSFDAAPLYQDLVAAITTLFTVYTEVQIKFTFFLQE